MTTVPEHLVAAPAARPVPRVSRPVARSRNGAGVVGTLAVAAAVVIVLGPLLWVVRVALKPPEDYIGAPASLGGRWTVENLTTVWSTGGMAGAIAHSAVAVAVGAVVSVGLAALTGYRLARYRFIGRGVVGALVTVTLFLPQSALVIPLFELTQQLNLLDSLPGLGLVYGVLFSAWATIFMRSFFLQLPEEVFESGQVDGAGAVRLFTAIALPMARPAVATAFILSCFLQWSELLLALILLPTGDQPTVSVAIAQFSSQFRTGGPLTAAAMIVGTLPVLLLFLVGQRWLQAGVLSGAVKD